MNTNHNVSTMPKATRRKPAERLKPRVRVPALCVALADFKRRNPGKKPKYDVLSVAMGLAPHAGSICAVIQAAISLGYIKHKRPKTHGLEFTAKGIHRFMPELIEQKPAFAEVDETGPEPDYASLLDLPPLADERPQTVIRETVDLAEPTLTSTDYYHASDAQLILELIERGYTVSKR